MAAHVRFKNELTENEKCHNLMSRLKRPVVKQMKGRCISYLDRCRSKCSKNRKGQIHLFWTSDQPLPMINDIWQSLCLAHVNSNVYA